MAGYSAIGLMRPKSQDNVGGVMRAAQIYGASLLCWKMIGRVLPI